MKGKGGLVAAFDRNRSAMRNWERRLTRHCWNHCARIFRGDAYRLPSRVARWRHL